DRLRPGHDPGRGGGLPDRAPQRGASREARRAPLDPIAGGGFPSRTALEYDACSEPVRAAPTEGDPKMMLDDHTDALADAYAAESEALNLAEAEAARAENEAPGGIYGGDLNPQVATTTAVAQAISRAI